MTKTSRRATPSVRKSPEERRAEALAKQAERTAQRDAEVIVATVDDKVKDRLNELRDDLTFLQTEIRNSQAQLEYEIAQALREQKVSLQGHTICLRCGGVREVIHENCPCMPRVMQPPQRR